MEATINQVKNEFDILPEDEQAEIARRRLICSECPFNSENAKSDGYKTNRVDVHCTMCGCTITRKTASLKSACGVNCCNARPVEDCDCKKTNLKKYNEELNINMQLRWDVYKKY